MKKSLIIACCLALSFTSMAMAKEGKGGMCKKKYSCKEKKDDAKISCWNDVLNCQKEQMTKGLTKLSSKVGTKKFADRKAKKIEKLTHRISKVEERTQKVQEKLTKLKEKVSKAQGEKKTKLESKIKMKEARLAHMTKKIGVLKEHKSQIEVLN